MLQQMNGRGTHPMTTPAPKPPEEGPEKPEHTIYLFALRLWILCCMIIVGFGILNFVLNRLLGTGH